LDKTIEFDTVDRLGNCFAEAIQITRRGGGLEKVAGQLHPEVSAYLRNLKSDPKYQYVLMTPMGSFEYWGMNQNGDIFPDSALAFNRDRDNPLPVILALEEKWLSRFGKKCPPGNYTNFGHKTFLEALRYRHHANKNPDIAYGDITLAVWNPAMHRAEVISRHDREKAKRVGAEEIISDLDAGKSRQISMGCKVPFDVCTLCGHMSKTPHDYCEHLRTMMGSILPDGAIVGAVNLFPRFFDLSDVFIPAARESGVIMKVAQVRGSFRTDSGKLAAQNKRAEISKDVLPNASRQALESAIAQEPDLPRAALRVGDFGTLLSSLAALGIILKPHEFQDGLLTRMGEPDLADELWGEGQTFRPMPFHGVPQTLERPSPGIMRLMTPFLSERSGLCPYLPQRVMRITIVSPPPRAPISGTDSPVLQKVAHVYGAYRAALRNLPALLAVAVDSDSEYYQTNFFRELLTDSMEKLSSPRSTANLFPSLVPLYVYNAHQGGVAAPPPSWDFEVPSNSPARALLRSNL